MVILCVSASRNNKDAKEFERKVRHTLLKNNKLCIEFSHAMSPECDLSKIAIKRPPNMVVFNRGVPAEEVKRKRDLISQTIKKTGNNSPIFKRVHDGDDLINGIINIPEIEHCLS